MSNYQKFNNSILKLSIRKIVQEMCQVMVVSPSRISIILLQPVSLWFPYQDTATQPFKCITNLTLTKQFSQSTTRFRFHLLQWRSRWNPSPCSTFQRGCIIFLTGCDVWNHNTVSSLSPQSGYQQLLAASDNLWAEVSSTNTHSIHFTTAGCQGTWAKPHLNGSIHSVWFFSFQLWNFPFKRKPSFI